MVEPITQVHVQQLKHNLSTACCHRVESPRQVMFAVYVMRIFFQVISNCRINR